MQIPLFPLNTVLFPGGPLPLRIFESRYLDMISRCMKDDVPFGVLLIREGQEAGGPASTWQVGTLARVTDWYQGSDGLLGITAIGTEHFRLESADRRPDGLAVGQVALIPAPPTVAVPAEHRHLKQLLDTVLNDLGRLYADLERRPDDAVWLAWRFVEILPIEAEQKQAILETDDIPACLQMIERVLRA